MMEMNNVWFALGMTLFAGLSTGIGSAIAFFARRTNTRFLSLSLGFSAGVMIYVSFVEIFSKARESIAAGFEAEASATSAYWITVAAFFGGMLLIALIDKFVPEVENPHEMQSLEAMSSSTNEAGQRKLMKMGLFTALAIAIHNFPEGIATFSAAMADPALGLPIAVAIAIHNIPEGIAVSVPIFYATGSKKKAFWYSFTSGLAEPVGALVAFAVLMPFLSSIPWLMGTVFASVAGIMVFISLDELLPAAEKFGEHHYAIYGLISGMALMALSLLLFA